MVCKSTRIPRIPECEKWCVQGSCFLCLCARTGKRLPINTFWSCACSDAMHLLSPAPQYCILQYSILWVVGKCIYSMHCPLYG